MAGDTADPLVVGVKALAFSKPIGLEADVGDAGLALRRYFCPGAMAVAAEVGHFLSRRVLQLKRSILCFMCRKPQAFFRGDVRIK
ncbi:MAG TPA: hypothetical protein V6C72_10905, partial [Chroococcales cyanobacterium]